MRYRRLLGCACCLAFFSALYAVQQPFRQYPGVEYRRFELPPDWEEKTEWAFARLMFPPGPNDGYRDQRETDQQTKSAVLHPVLPLHVVAHIRARGA